MRNLIRLALKAGDFREIFRLSREARALENLNRTGGISGPGPSQRDWGDYRTEQFMSDPDFLGREYLTDAMDGSTEYRGTLPDGRGMVFDPSTGTRRTFARQRDYPIEAPYEGFRVWPTSPTPFFPTNLPSNPTPPFARTPPQWQGMGTPPRPLTERGGFSPLSYNANGRETWVGPNPLFPNRGDVITDGMGNIYLDDGFAF